VLYKHIDIFKMIGFSFQIKSKKIGL